MQNIRTIFLACLICALSVTCLTVNAQRALVEIRGQVTDEHGGAITGAKVSVLFPDGTEKTSVTDQQGIYVYKSVPAGSCTFARCGEGLCCL